MFTGFHVVSFEVKLWRGPVFFKVFQMKFQLNLNCFGLSKIFNLRIFTIVWSFVTGVGGLRGKCHLHGHKHVFLLQYKFIKEIKRAFDKSGFIKLY